MASSSLTPYISNVAQETYSLVSSSENKSTWKKSGRALSTPQTVDIIRTIKPGASNDHIQVRIARVEQNTTTAKLATAQVLLDISVPKDQSILDNTEISKMLGSLASLINESAALAATSANRVSLIEGRDL